MTTEKGKPSAEHQCEPMEDVSLSPEATTLALESSNEA